MPLSSMHLHASSASKQNGRRSRELLEAQVLGLPASPQPNRSLQRFARFYSSPQLSRRHTPPCKECRHRGDFEISRPSLRPRTPCTSCGHDRLSGESESFTDNTPPRRPEDGDAAQLIGVETQEGAPRWKRSLSRVRENMKAWFASDSRDNDASFVEARTEKKHWTEL